MIQDYIDTLEAVANGTLPAGDRAKAAAAAALAELKARDESSRLVNTYIDQLSRELVAARDYLTAALADVERLTRERDELRRVNEVLRVDAKRLDGLESLGFGDRFEAKPLRTAIDIMLTNHERATGGKADD